MLVEIFENRSPRNKLILDRFSQQYQGWFVNQFFPCYQRCIPLGVTLYVNPPPILMFIA